MNDKSEIIVSLTILPSRILKLKKVLNSLRNQVISSNYFVKVYIPRNPIRDNPLKELPDFLLDTSWFDDFGKGKLLYSFVEDIGPITKIIPALQEFPNHIIVTCDDDGYYPSNWLSGLITKFDGTEVVAYRGRKFVNGSMRYNNTELFECHAISESHYADIVTGTWGAVYVKDFFDQSFFEDYNKNSYWNRIDDIWISGHLWKKKIKIKILQNNEPIDPMDCSEVNSLWAINKISNFNDQGISYFKKYLPWNSTRHFSIANVKMRFLRPVKNIVKAIPELARTYELVIKPPVRTLAQ